MHQHPRATEQPFALKIASRSGQREGVKGRIASMVGFCPRPQHSRALGQARVAAAAQSFALRNPASAPRTRGRGFQLVNDIVNIFRTR